MLTLSHAGLARGQPDTAPSTAIPIEFWVVEPNEGQSAGGHVAIRIGDWLYHIEHRGDGLIADRRTPRRSFERIYRGLGNRAISAIPLTLSSREAASLREQLESRFFSRRRRLGELDALDREAAWLARTQVLGYLALELPGVGLFDDASSCAAPGSDTALVNRIEQQHGRGWLEARRDRAQGQTRKRVLEILDREDWQKTTGPLGEAPKSERRRALARLTDSVNVWAAFDILLECRTVRTERLHVAPQQPPAVTPNGTVAATSTATSTVASTEAWTRSREALLDRLVELVASPREDLGLPLLLGWARLQALDRSVALGALHVVDPFEEAELDPQIPIMLRGRVPEPWIARRETAAERRWRAARAKFEAGTGSLEARIADLERSHHRLAHARSGSLHRTPPMPSFGVSIATRYASAERILPWPDRIATDAPGEAFERVSSQAKALRHAMTDELGYQLFTRNCVTELLSALDASTFSLRHPSGPHPDRRTTLLSADATGFVDVVRGRFIPVIAGRAVEEIYAGGTANVGPKADSVRITLPSSRELRLEELRASGGTSALREATTLTSRTYQSNAADSIFLFFSDVPTLARPFIGVANLAYGLSAAGVGVLLAPFDRGESVRRGLQGALMSVPEIFFFQVRRGSYPVAPPFDANRSGDIGRRPHSIPPSSG